MEDTMDIHSPNGTMVVFMFPNAGWREDQRVAKKHLAVGGKYTVDYTEVHNWHTDVYLKEVPNVAFNSVHFQELYDE